MDDIRTNTLAITPEILGLIAQIDEFKGAWTALGRISPERLSSLRRVATIESAGSSTRIEGAKLSDKEVDALLSKIAVKALASRDEEEVAGYAAVMETIFASWQEIALTENHIRQLHRDLLQYAGKDDRHRGVYKTQNNHVEAFGADGKSLGVVFETALPFDTPRLMAELVAWTRERLVLGDLPELSVQILELCRERGRITVAEAEKLTGANRNTIKDHLKALARAGHIVQHGAGRGAWYGLA